MEQQDQHGPGGGEEPEQSAEQATEQEGGGQRQDGGTGDAQVPSDGGAESGAERQGDAG